MNSRIYSVLISFWLRLFFHWTGGATELQRFLAPKGFLAHRTIQTFQRYCTCNTSYSCSCCQSVIILYTKAEKNLCINFTYQRNGLNIDMTLNSDILRARTITDYKPFKFCSNIPGCYFSTACVNLLELNKFSRSITACLRLDIFSKKRLWQLNYDCVSISTELPTIPSNGTMSTMNGTKEMGMTSAMTVQMTMTTAMTTAVETEETTSTDVEVITVAGSQPTTVVDID